MTKKLNHDELQGLLADHLASMNDRAIWQDMQLGPSGSPRPDVYSLYKSYTRPRPLAYEVKVSVSDFRSDVTKGKWQSYLDYASGVIFCVPKGLIQKGDVPDSCGLMTYNPENGAFRNVKGPVLQNVTIPQNALMKLIIDGIEREHRNTRREVATEFAMEQRVRSQIGERVASAVFDPVNAERQAEHQIKIIEARKQHAQKELKEIEADVSEARDRHRAQLRESVQEAAAAFGLDPQSPVPAIARAIKNRAQELNRDDVIRELTGQIRQLRGLAERQTPLERILQEDDAA